MNTTNSNQTTERQYQLKIGIGGIEFQPCAIDDPVPTGRQILACAGVNSKEGWSVFAILPSGDFEDVRLDETFDLRGKGTEQFVAFQTDRDFKLTLKGNQLEWGKPVITGRELGKLANLKEDEAVFLEVPGGEDRLVEENDVISLTEPGIERFIVAAKPKPGYEIFVNGRPRIVEDEVVTYEQVTELAFPGQGGPQIDFAVSYRKAASAPHSGELVKSQSVTVKNKGTIFNVTLTDKS
ncbi:MAG: hypothetical protein BGO12_09550 [Verrucomicrobia bacterium 61-8]|nr:MAG: hypothetical protein BGO12_09550 [Verrucomicrobia bacterium 61-8]